MAIYVQMQAPEGLGGQIRGEWGHYQQDDTGLFQVDSRDALNLLALGLTVVPPVAGTGAVSAARPSVTATATKTA